VLCLAITIALTALMASSAVAHAQQKRASGFGQRAVVVDERLAVLRDEPGLYARLLKRLARGRFVTILNTKRTRDGLAFYRVAVTRRTRGWVQTEAIAAPWREGDDARFLNLIRASDGFDRIGRASLFLETFPRSALRPAVLLMLGDAVESAARRLSLDAARRLDEDEMRAGGAPVFSYFLNFSGLDRYRRLGVEFIYEPTTRQFHYDGAGWREILRRHSTSAEAAEARQRLASRGLGREKSD
jgi:hypothetical protein